MECKQSPNQSTLLQYNIFYPSKLYLILHLFNRERSAQHLNLFKQIKVCNSSGLIRQQIHPIEAFFSFICKFWHKIHSNNLSESFIEWRFFVIFFIAIENDSINLWVFCIGEFTECNVMLRMFETSGHNEASAWNHLFFGRIHISSTTLSITVCIINNHFASGF